MLCALMYRQNGDLANLLKSARKKVPQSARLSAGGCNRYLGNAQIEVTLTSKVLPLPLALCTGLSFSAVVTPLVFTSEKVVFCS